MKHPNNQLKKEVERFEALPHFMKLKMLEMLFSSDPRLYDMATMQRSLRKFYRGKKRGN